MHQIHNPTHPGEILLDRWPSGLTLTAAAKQLGIPRSTLANIQNGDAEITSDIATKLDNWGGISSERWLLMQTSHNQWIERRNSHTNEAIFQNAA